MNLAAIHDVVSAVLYEGYALYPYRATAVKNQQRWTFGGVYPAALADTEAVAVQTECLLYAAADAVVAVRVRFLHLVARGRTETETETQTEPGARRSPDAWQEAVERDVATPAWALADLLDGPREVAFAFPPEASTDGAVVRRQEGLAGVVRVAAAAIEPGPGAPARVFKLTVVVRNVTPFVPPPAVDGRADRDAALMHAFASTHTLLGVERGAFVSLLDPPEALRAAAAACRNVGTWPVLVGEAPARDTVLSSPIILYDYPRVAPQSPGDLFDATEIDEVLTLRVLTLTDAEKEAMRSGDARVRAILERAEALSPADLLRLHGTLRRPGVTAVRTGDRVRLQPHGRADVFDLALRGMAATVVAIEQDYEGRVFLAVTVDEDPGRDLGLAGKPGHRFFFRPEEVEPLP